MGEPLALPLPCPELADAEGTVGEADDGMGLEAAMWTLWDEDRLKNGIEDGVRRLDWWRLTEEAGLSGVFWALDGIEVVVLLTLEPVPGRLEAFSRSGVLEAKPGDFGVRVDPTEDSEARDAAEVMASRWTGDQETLLVAGGDSACSLDARLRNCWLKFCIDRGLSGKLEDLLVSLSFIDAIDGELVNFIFSAFEKLHFLEGVLLTDGMVSGAD